MSFHLSASDVHIDDNHILVAVLRDEEGEEHESTLDLDEFLGNNEGRFDWGGNGFSGSARDVTFSIEGGGEVPVLRAELANSEGEYFPADVNLSEHIENDNGKLVYQ
ncbi:CVNH domain-containing protein [Aspergillus aculeatinus CBS 121060]|uniref:Cyanovirin-N n=2 Tax=Aspergillus subgen. Circumdati TaxID=2720871 RepID=A0A2V5I3I4_9EURO|nr:Cyanovirin-N [Aspergillus aculeatinus CBS 121060]PYI30651.1 Cyanovirin-N [Aspergillus indologenus CBS 114.80]RAH67039.1 Cyanovirin-N [Aspergillus aculeatinus CBS 121060]